MNNIQDRLHIFIVTYNRVAMLERTLRQILGEASPVRDCAITVLNNHSTDDTAALVNGFRRDHRNVELITHAKNIGGNANICRAMELADKEYYWILGDDDLYDFSNWNAVEEAMARGEDVILLSRYLLSDVTKDDLAYQLVQATFISGTIVRTSLVTDSVLTEAYNSIYTLFPQSVPILNRVNTGGRYPCVGDASRRERFSRSRCAQGRCVVYTRLGRMRRLALSALSDVDYGLVGRYCANQGRRPSRADTDGGRGTDARSRGKKDAASDHASDHVLSQRAGMRPALASRRVRLRRGRKALAEEDSPFRDVQRLVSPQADFLSSLCQMPAVAQGLLPQPIETLFD